MKNALVIESKNLLKSLNKIIKKTSIKELYYNPQELSKFDYDTLRSYLSVKLKKKSNFSQKKRVIKTADEIENLKKAVEIGKKSFKDLAELLQYSGNINERKLNFLAQSVISGAGTYDLSFDPIIAVDENSAKPHAFASLKKTKKDSIILLDAGLKYNRYCSDRTRIGEFNSLINFSKQQNFKNPKVQKIYDIVLKAHDEAIKSIKVGMRARDIDKIARDIIVKAGYEKQFVHSTGHGVGLDIHELPRISKKDKTIIEEGMVFTIEPGIYLPDEFGIRIEDMVLVTQNGAEVL